MYLQVSKKAKEISQFETFDTETCDGYIFLVTWTKGIIPNYRFFDIKSNTYQEDLINFLFEKLPKRHFFVHNLGYDLDSIFKTIFTIEEIQNLLLFGELDYKEYKLTFIPNKYFEIEKDDEKIIFWNSFNIFPKSLDSLGKQFLNIGKQKQDLNVSLFKYWNYVNENLEKIIHYGKYDVIILKKVLLQFHKYLQSMQNTKYRFSFLNPFSTASLSENNFMLNVNIPNFNSILRKKWKSKVDTNSLMQYVKNSYCGGFFETFKKGYIDEKIYKYDIVSAYPNSIQNLLDINFSSPVFTKDFESKEKYGVYQCAIDITQPIKAMKNIRIKKNHYVPNCFLIGKIPKIYLLTDEINFLLKNNQNVEIYDGFYLEFDEKIQVFKEFTNFLFEHKQLNKKSNIMLSNIFKIFLNSYYGKTWQQITKMLKTSNLRYCPFCNFQNGKISDHIRKIHKHQILEFNGEDYIKSKRYGKNFNPFYANLITMDTRLTILNYYYKYPNSIFSVNTDDFYSLEQLQNIENLNTKKLGTLEEKKYDYGIYLNNGLSDFFSNENIIRKRRGCEKTYIDTCENLERKIEKNEKMISNFLLSNVLKTHKKYFPVLMYKPLKLKETLKQVNKYHFSDINKFMILQKLIQINSHKKRKWNSNFSGFDIILKKEICDSKPFIYEKL